MIPGDTIIIGIFVQVLVALATAAVRLAWRSLRCCVVDHPLLTALLFTAAWQQGWLEVWIPELMVWAAWFPSAIAGLVGLGVLRWCTPNHIAETRRFYRREIRARERWASDQVRDWRKDRKAERERVRDLPPPPVPPPDPGPTTESTPPAPATGDVLDVNEVPTAPPIPVGPVTEGATP